MEYYYQGNKKHAATQNHSVTSVCRGVGYVVPCTGYHQALRHIGTYEIHGIRYSHIHPKLVQVLIQQLST